MRALASSVFLLLCVSQIHGEDGILYARPVGASSDWSLHFCIDFNPYFEELPSSHDQAVVKPLADLSHTEGCSNDSYTDTVVMDKVVMVARGNCSFTEKAYLALQHGAIGLIIASNELLSPGPMNATVDYQQINITMATLLWADVHTIQAAGGPQEVIVFSPTLTRYFDPNMVVIFLLACSLVIIGGFWSGVSRHDKYLKYQRKQKRKAGTQSEDQGSQSTGSGDSVDDSDDDDECEKEEDTVDVSAPVIAVFFLLVCGFIVLLYFFYDYLVYVVIGVFVLAGATGMFYCFLPLWKRIIPFSQRIPRNRIPILRDRPEIRGLLLLALCLGVCIFWAVQRHASYAWVLQDILGYFFCINVLKTVHVPNLKVCTLMLSLLFVYDVFFVFITPLFTKSGDSVMVSVATGDNSKTGEQLPMVFKVPHLGRDEMSVCPQPFSMLGFGDVIVPGLLVAHNHMFDLRVGSRRIYFLATVVAYAIGLVITYVALSLMKTGQPALLYLVPCTLLTTFVIGCIRKEVRKLWSGIHHHSKKDDTQTADKIPRLPPNTTPPTVLASANSSNSISSSGTDNEERVLLRR